ncbi:MAG: DUF4296 domain-containing protein [Saprospiraceae bacterium]
MLKNPALLARAPHVHMRVLVLYGLSILFVFSACWGNKAAVPTIPEDKMVRIMADLSIAEAATAQMNGYAKDSLTKVFYNQVFEMHQVQADQYEQNLRLYANDLPTMERIVQRVEATFETEKKADQ